MLAKTFTEEDEISVLLYLTTVSNHTAAAREVLHARRAKAEAITMPFQALKFAGAPGIDATTIQIVDMRIAA